MSAYISLAVDGKLGIYLDEAGNLALAHDAEAIAQGCTRAMTMLKAEARFDTDAGVDYVGTIYVDGASQQSAFEDSARQALLDVPGVTDVTAIASDIVDGQLYFMSEVETVYGSVLLSSGV